MLRCSLATVEVSGLGAVSIGLERASRVPDPRLPDQTRHPIGQERASRGPNPEPQSWLAAWYVVTALSKVTA